MESRFKAKLESFAAEEASEPSSEAGQVAPEPDPHVGDENGVGAFAEVPEESAPFAAASLGRPFACATRSIADSCPPALRPHTGRAPGTVAHRVPGRRSVRLPSPRAKTIRCQRRFHLHLADFLLVAELGPRLVAHIFANSLSYGDEASCSAGVNVVPVPIALARWQRTRPDFRLAEFIGMTPADPGFLLSKTTRSH